MSDKLRMDAYYYGFEETGCKEIDLILSAVACAGKACHHTDGWMDEDRPYPPHEGQCPVDWIQNAAKKAVVLIKELEAEKDALEEATTFARNRLEKMCSDKWNGDARDFKRCLHGVFLEYDAAIAKAKEKTYE